MLIYFDEHCHGFFDKITDIAYIMDDYGNAVEVNWSLDSWYWQEV